MPVSSPMSATRTSAKGPARGHPDVNVPLGATVVRRQLKLRDILNMQPGDVIPVEMPEDMIMRANGMPAFKVKLGAHKGNLALQVLEPVVRPR